MSRFEVTPTTQAMTVSEQRLNEVAPPVRTARTRLLRKLGIVLPISLVVVYVISWALSVRSFGSWEHTVRRSDFMPTLTGAMVIRQGNAPQLYDLSTQTAAQQEVLSPYFTTDSILPYN